MRGARLGGHEVKDSMNAVSQGGLSHQPIAERLIERVKADGVELVSWSGPEVC